MNLASLIEQARARGASDLHLEPGLPLALRIRGRLSSAGEPLAAPALVAMARDLLGTQLWEELRERRSADLSRTIAGVRCRVNVLHTARGVGLAIRLLPAVRPTLRRLNLHPDLGNLVVPSHGLVVVSGPSGSGKSSTLAALLEEINQVEARHVITLEEPIEYVFRPRRAFLRQREVGRDTPSFEQGLRDALREDPDVLMVGELRHPETMRLTLSAAETGHLVLTTVHSATTAEALQRIVMAFPPEIQLGVCAQLADCLVGVVSQRLRFRVDLGIRVPECEILLGTSGVKGLIRQAGFSKLPSAIEAGGKDGMYTYERYQTWLARRRDWHVPEPEEAEVVSEPEPAPTPAIEEAPLRPPRAAAPAPRPPANPVMPAAAPSEPGDPGVLVIDDPEEDAAEILSRLEGPPGKGSPT